MNDEVLETYLNIVKTHSLTKTAENMFISQSAVSNRLISLEKELNVKLIERSPGQKGILLTQKGEEFVEFAKRHQELNRQIQDWSRGDVTGSSAVASVISLTDYVKGYRTSKGKPPSLFATHRLTGLFPCWKIEIDIDYAAVFYSKAVRPSRSFRNPCISCCRSVSSHPDFIDAKTLKRAHEIYFGTGEKISSNGTKPDESFRTPTDGHGHNRITRNYFVS